MSKATIKVSVLYKQSEGKTFNIDYYCNKHVPMVKKTLGDALLSVSVAKGLGGGSPNSLPTYEVIGCLFFESMEIFQNSFGPNAEEIGKDAVNFTNIEPIIQISEIVLNE